MLAHFSPSALSLKSIMDNCSTFKKLFICKAVYPYFCVFLWHSFIKLSVSLPITTAFFRHANACHVAIVFNILDISPYIVNRNIYIHNIIPVYRSKNNLYGSKD